MELSSSPAAIKSCELNADYGYPFEIAGYNQHEPGTCIIATTRSILNTLGSAGEITAEEIDTRIGREPNELASIDRIHLLLLEGGVRLHSVCAFDDDRFSRQGIVYLEKYYGIGTPNETWPASEFYEYFTPEEIEKQLSDLSKVVAHPNFSQETRNPELSDIFQAIKDGKLVRIATGKPDEAAGNLTTPSEIIIGFTTTKTIPDLLDPHEEHTPEYGKWLRQPRVTLISPVFDPQKSISEPYTATLDNFLEFWRADDGIMIIDKA